MFQQNNFIYISVFWHYSYNNFFLKEDFYVSFVLGKLPRDCSLDFWNINFQRITDDSFFTEHIYVNRFLSLIFFSKETQHVSSFPDWSSSDVTGSFPDLNL
jgi:hypothetical protein